MWDFKVESGILRGSQSMRQRRFRDPHPNPLPPQGKGERLADATTALASARAVVAEGRMRVLFAICLLPFAMSSVVNAANRYWIANGGATNWNNTANWSATSG